MSRCYPYPPPNYRREKSQAEPIKLQKEQETAKESRKEKKKEKKERKEKRDKSKDKHEYSKHKEHGHKKRKYDERNELLTEDGYQKAATKDVIEQLEKSGLTEEHGLFPMQEPCESSESTQNSSKSRKLEVPNICGGGSHDCVGSTILRFKLPLQKHKDLKPTHVTEEPCFSGRATSNDLEATPENEEPFFSGHVTSKDLKTTQAVQPTPKDLKATTSIPATFKDLKATPSIQATSKGLKATPAIRATSEDLKATPSIRGISKDLQVTPVNEEPCYSGRDASKCLEATPANERSSCFPGRATEMPMELDLGDNAHSQSINSSKIPEAPMEVDLGVHGHSHSSSRSKKGSKRSRKLERQFRDLIVNWKPVPLLDAEAGTDMGWLFESSQQRQVSSDAHSCSVSSIGEDLSVVGSFQPRACYLPELEMYQLPYAVPF